MQFRKKEKKKMTVVFLLSLMIALGVYLWNREGENIVSLQRNTAGEGSYTEELQAFVEGQEDGVNVQVEVPEQKYAEESVEERLKEARKILEKIVLAENERYDYISKDLNLVSKVPDTAIQVSWIINDYSVMDVTGHIVAEQIPEEGKAIELLAELTYDGHRESWKKEATVYPPESTEEDKLKSKLAKILDQSQKSSEENEMLILPTELEGNKIIWKKKYGSTILYILTMGVLLAFLIPAKRIQDEKQEDKKRRKELENIYPDFIRRFQLYIGAGMSVRNTFQKLERDYRREQGSFYIQKEISRLIREIGSGIPEVQCYEMFGERCGLPMYRKFGTILSQNVRKGTRGMRELLQKEAEETLEDRKALARRKGEEAGTKLLLPMFFMLGTVMVMIIVPAFMGMGF